MKTHITELFKFFDHVDARGILPTGTVHGRRAAAKAVFSVLDGEEESTVEYVVENLDSILHRFTVKNRAEVKGQTLETYKSRLRSALQDFEKWSRDPGGWEREIMAKARKAKAEGEEAPKAKKQAKPAAAAEVPSREASSEKGGQVVTLPIRMGQFAVSATLPTDGLTLAELKKLSNWLSLFLKEDEVLSLPRTGTSDSAGVSL